MRKKNGRCCVHLLYLFSPVIFRTAPRLTEPLEHAKFNEKITVLNNFTWHLCIQVHSMDHLMVPTTNKYPKLMHCKGSNALYHCLFLVRTKIPKNQALYSQE